MDKAIVDFIRALRHHGLPVSSAETLDAIRAAAAIGISNRARLKAGLSMTLAKTLADRGLLEELFDDYFSPGADNNPALSGDTEREPEDAAPGEEYRIQSSLGLQLHENDLVAMLRSMKAAAEAAGAQEMKIFLQKNRVASQILLKMGDRELQHELQELQSRGEHLALVAELQKKRALLVDRVKDYVEKQYLLFSGKKGEQLSEDTLQRVKLAHIDHIQQQQMARLIRKIAKKLASLNSRRRKIYKRGMLDVRKTIAANAAFDGYLFHTRWKSTRIDRPRVIVICDVSRSVSEVSRFLLLFLYSLQEVLPRVRSFVFSGQMVEVTNTFKAYDLEEALALIMERWAHHSTDYGRALKDFSDMAMADIDHKTQIIMLGDARNNFDDGRVDIWRTIYTRAQRVLWLNPEDRSKWNTGDSIMKEYGTYCSMVEHCSSVRDMERVLGRLLKYTA